MSSWRQKALDHIYEHICADDQFTKGISIGPVSNNIMNLSNAWIILYGKIPNERLN